MKLKDFIKVQCRANFIRFKIGRLNLYVANHAMQVIQFEKKAQQKKTPQDAWYGIRPGKPPMRDLRLCYRLDKCKHTPHKTACVLSRTGI